MFGDRKNGRAPIVYPHPLLEGILAETYGIFVYQEQVMQAAQVLAGYTLGEADLLRRAMGKKIKSEMDAQRATLRRGLQAHNQIPAAKANELFDLIDKFAGYGFNKSHAAGYALIAYQTAWLKAHHRAEFYAASMSFDLAQTDKLALFVEDIRRGGVECLPPDINASHAHFTVENGAVRYALGALKGVGEKAMEALVAERERGGPFSSLEDFAARDRPTAAQPPPARKPRRGRRVRQHQARPAGGVRRGRDDPRPCRERARPADQRPGGPVRWRIVRGRADPPAARRLLDAGRSAWPPSATPSVSISRPTRSMRSATCSPRTRSGRFAELAEIRHRPRASARARPWRRWSRKRALADLGHGAAAT